MVTIYNKLSIKSAFSISMIGYTLYMTLVVLSFLFPWSKEMTGVMLIFYALHLLIIFICNKMMGLKTSWWLIGYFIFSWMNVLLFFLSMKNEDSDLITPDKLVIPVYICIGFFVFNLTYPFIMYFRLIKKYRTYQ